ncbi:hypothetical protein [Butyrivibrio sp. FCS014]|uniref:hypothetical protein n=1 Tax=Butyrivibrio sp. FCS014 TaxID=1408304 RepID=UPI0004660579|nr:hypothetical protein [Butyrivibrio sp. FCS014]
MTYLMAFMDTLDMMAQYNYNKNDPLVGDVNLDAMALAEGKCGTWFMGDWAWTYMAELVEPGAEFRSYACSSQR